MACVVCYEPAPRRGHVATAVEGKLYVWGGITRDWPYVHHGPTKTAFASVVDVLDIQVKARRKLMSDTEIIIRYTEMIIRYALRPYISAYCHGVNYGIKGWSLQ